MKTTKPPLTYLSMYWFILDTPDAVATDWGLRGFSKTDPTGDLKRMLTCGVIVQISTSQGSQGGVEGLRLTLIESKRSG
jgi:hypothetical protein